MSLSVSGAKFGVLQIPLDWIAKVQDYLDWKEHQMLYLTVYVWLRSDSGEYRFPYERYISCYTHETYPNSGTDNED